MNRLPSLLLILSAATGAMRAQSVNATIRALAPIQVQAVSGGQSMVDSRPVGPLAVPDYVSAFVAVGNDFADTSVNWSIDNPSDRTVIRVYQSLLSGLPTAVLSAGPQEFVVELTATAPGVPVTVLVRHEIDGSAFAPMPQVQIDFDNDGTIDLDQPGNGGEFAAPFTTLGLQPTAIRVVVAGTLQGAGSMLQRLTITAIPQNGLLIATSAIGCQPQSMLTATEVFADRGVDFELYSGFAQDPALLMLGLSQQPFLLPSFLGAPCLVLPSPDIFLFDPTIPIYHVALPAAVRPVTFYAQGIVVSANGLLTTDGYTVSAL